MNTRLRTQALGMIVGLALQFLLGMATNLFVEFPDSSSENELWSFAWHQLPLALHIILGLTMAIGSATLLVRAIRSKSTKWIAPAWGGFLCIILADFAGSQFVSTQTDAYSYLMAVGFIGAILAYVWGLAREQGK